MIIDITDFDIALYDGDTETESGELHSVEEIIIDGTEISLVMDDGDTWDYEDLSQQRERLHPALLSGQGIP